MTTNGEWLDYLAHNAPDELAAWFDAEHVEHQDGTLDGDTAALNAKIAELTAERDELREKLGDTTESISELMKKQPRTFDPHDVSGSLRLVGRYIDELELRLVGKPECDICDRTTLLEEVEGLTAERDKLKELNGYHAVQYELASEDCDRLQAQVDELTAERDNWEANCEDWKKDCERYRSKFGKCLDYADAIHALMDEGMA